MILTKRLRQNLIEKWLVIQTPISPSSRYRLRVWKENHNEFDAIKEDLIEYFESAFADAKERLHKGFDISLSPFKDTILDPAANYPTMLHRNTLLGYFGETLSVIAVEHWGALGLSDWQVPFMLFRMHEIEFQHLETINERIIAGINVDPDDVAEIRPGRTGDDAIVFRIDDKNIITDVLTLEAKCLSANNNTKIKEAHEKLVNSVRRPTSIHELIEILHDYNSKEAKQWQESLLHLWSNGYINANRHDGVCYACAETPKKKTSWLDPDKPHPAYTLKRNLECMEFHLQDLKITIDAIFKREK
jgi:hypothetical protein